MKKYSKDQLIRAMEAAGYYYDEINSDESSYLVFNSSPGIRASFHSWKEVEEWLRGVVFDDPKTQDAVDAVMYESRKRIKESIEIIKPRRRNTETYYTLNWYWKHDPTGGFSFPCDEDGNAKLDEMQPAAIKNYKWCMSDNGKKLTGPEIEENTFTYTDNAIAKCKCGDEIELFDQYQGACECPNCGRWYNMFGQELVKPQYWEENNDDYYYRMANDYSEYDY